jgi:hypothetical protein
MKPLRKQKDFEDAISLVLRKQWNPIGFDDDLPMDEYKSYAPRIYQLLSENCNAYLIAQLLSHICVNIIGINDDWYKTVNVAELLVTSLQKEIVEFK